MVTDSPAPDTSQPVRVLCVDDEPNVLDGLARTLRRRFDVTTAVGGAAGLEVLRQDSRGFAVVMSDLRMPGMDGATFLGRVREQAPDAVRVLLTGQGDLETAAAAVNQGQIFRFLLKPCAPEVLQQALDASVAQHELVTSERVLLEQTLYGSIKALTDVLALVNPEAFGRAMRAKTLAAEIATRLEVPDRWQVEVAAMLSQIGSVTLPGETAERLYKGGALSEAEQYTADRLPTVAADVVANIPRMDAVRKIFTYQSKRYDGKGLPHDSVQGDDLPIGARILKAAIDCDVLECHGMKPDAALGAMRARTGWYDPKVLEALAEVHAADAEQNVVRAIPLEEVRPGMILAEDLKTEAGMLLVARGHEVTDRLVMRLQNLLADSMVKGSIHVILS